MSSRPVMPIPDQELTPDELRQEIEDWAVGQGYLPESTPARSEAWKVVVRDPNGGHTYTTIHKAHKSRKLRRDQIRFAVRNLNNNWRD